MLDSSEGGRDQDGSKDKGKGKGLPEQEGGDQQEEQQGGDHANDGTCASPLQEVVDPCWHMPLLPQPEISYTRSLDDLMISASNPRQILTVPSSSYAREPNDPTVYMDRVGSVGLSLDPHQFSALLYGFDELDLDTIR